MDLSNTEKSWDVKREATIISHLSFNSLNRMILKGLIKDDDLIWHAGLSGWRKAGEQADLIPIFSAIAGGSARSEASGRAPGGKRK